MKYIFNFENRERPILFNKEKLLLCAMQNLEQLFYMLDTQYDGLYDAEALERKRRYGANAYQALLKMADTHFYRDRKQQADKVLCLLQHQKVSVFRRGSHFYSEITAEDIVPGDVLFLSRGDIVPSDIRIIFSKDLEVDQSLYTSRNPIARKSSSYVPEKMAREHFVNISNLCFTGSTVLNGLARGIVVSTGRATYLSFLLGM